MMSKSKFDQLTPAQQTAVLEAGEIAANFERDLFLEREAELFDDLQQMGVKVYTPTDAPEWSAKAADVIASEADNVGGKAWIERIQAVQ